MSNKTFANFTLSRTEFKDSFPIQVYHDMLFSELIGSINVGLYLQFRACLDNVENFADATVDENATDDFYHGLERLVEATKAHSWNSLPFDEEGDFPISEDQNLVTVYCHCELL